jgi:hypothetical protein
MLSNSIIPPPYRRLGITPPRAAGLKAGPGASGGGAFLGDFSGIIGEYAAH